MAVALLIVGSAAALYLQSVEQGARDPDSETGVGDLRAESAAAAHSLSAMARDVLDGAIASGFDPAQGLGPLRGLVQERLERLVAANFPRVGASGQTVDVNVTSVTVAPAAGTARIPSFFGGETMEQVPLSLAAEGYADVSLSGAGAPPQREVVGFAGVSAVPAALPLELAARAGAELLAGGMAERFASQAAQHLLTSSNVSLFAAEAAPDAVRNAVRTTLLWAFHASGNASFDTLAIAASGDDGLLYAGDLTGASHAPGDEAIDLGHAGEPFEMARGRATLRVVDYSDAALDVAVTRHSFSGQEVGPGIWQSALVTARGEVTFRVAVETAAGATTVGPIHIPVAIDARAAAGPLAPDLVVSPEQLAAAEDRARSCGTSCEVNSWLASFGLAVNATSEATEGLRQALLAFEIHRMASDLPPVERAGAFAASYGPPRLTLHAREVVVAGPDLTDGAVATFTLDGAPAGASLLGPQGAVTVRVPDGAHTLGVSVPCGEDSCAGGVTGDFSASVVPVRVAVAPAPSGAFLGGVVRRAVAANALLGDAALAQAEDLLGILEPSGNPAARLAVALTRADALLASGTLTAATRAAVADAKAFLKVSLVVLKASDAARKASGGSPAPVGQATAEAATLVIAPQTQLLLVATIHGTEIARLALSNGSLELSSPFGADGSTPTLDFRLQQVGLVATAALAGLTLGADLVRVQGESAEGDTAGLAIAVTRTAAHAADTLRQLSLGVLKVADRVWGTASTAALATTFAKASIVLGAVFLVLDLADLYHDAGGNLSLMADGLLHPATVAGMLTLPSLAQAAASTAAGALLLMSGEAIAAAGPVGLAAGLFVLAGVILLNGETFASAAFGTMTAGERTAFASAMGNRSQDLARILAFANGQDADASDSAARASALAAARLALASATAPDAEQALALAEAGAAARADAGALAARARIGRALKHAALSALEEMDDFASGNHTHDPGRETEGYGELEKVDANQGGWGRFPYGGDLVVQDDTALPVVTLSRPQWRALLPSLNASGLAHTHFGYRLTATDGIPTAQAQAFVATLQAGGSLLQELLGAYRALGP